jgi:hypothetical protein
VQQAVAKTVDQGGVEEESKEERLEDMANVIAFASRLAYFHLQKVMKNAQTHEFTTEFYEKSHEEICDALERTGVTVYCVAFIVHILMANLNVYSTGPEPAVSFGHKCKNGGQLAFMEIVLSLVMAGQCNDASRYNKNAEHQSWSFDSRDVGCYIRVPGIGLSQLDPRNVSALAFCHPILKSIGEGDMPLHNPAVTAHGKHGRKAEYFFDKPVYLDGFPGRHFDNDKDDELDTDEDEDEGN